MYHPSRGGVRGGADQFSWEDVKLDKHRENYLGHSVKAPVGRWQKGKDLTWYAKDRSGSNDRRNQIASIKQAEEEAMLAALGHQPIKRGHQPLSKEEVSEALKRNLTEREGERISGVGVSGVQLVSPSVEGCGVKFRGAPPSKHKKSSEKNENVSKHEEKKHKKKKKHRKEEKPKRRRHDSDSSSNDDANQKKHSSREYLRRRHDSNSS